MFGDRRKTGGHGFGPRLSTAITPTKRMTDVGAAASVRKADNRFSMGGGQHRTSLFQKNSAVAPRDVKSMLSANVRKIYNFFVEYEGADAPSESQIKSPKGKFDFINFFELLYQHLSCDYEFPANARLEDEISSTFRHLGYLPHLKNSYFQPMGSSHGYPHLVDALAWMVDIIRCNKCVSNDTQNILLGDFIEPAIAQEKYLSYSWMSSTFKEYTNDRKAAEEKNGPFWNSTINKLRKFFEDMNDAQDLTAAAKNALEQLRFECEEIEADKGTEQSLLEDINRLKDDIRKAISHYEDTKRVLNQRECDLENVKAELEARIKEHSEVQAEVNSLNQRIEEQKEKHGLTGKEVRQLNSNHSRDKAVVSEIQAELDKLSKELWLLKNKDTFKEKKASFIHLTEKIEKILAGTHINLGLEALQPPQNEQSLKMEWEKLNSVWLPEVTRQLHQKKLELEMEKSRFVEKFAAIEERVQMERETLCEAERKAKREERVRRNEREEWKESRLSKEERYDELENEQDVLERQIQMDGRLDREIEMENARKLKNEEEFRTRKAAIEASIRRKLDMIVAEITEIENEKMLFHVECNEFEKLILETQSLV